MWRVVVGVGVVSTAAALPLGAVENFEKVGLFPGQPVSPTGIATAPPATARAAGWTIVAPEASLGLMERNPAFLTEPPHAGLSITGGWEHRDDWGSFDSDLARLQAVTAEVRLAPVSLGFAYQMADRIDLPQLDIFRNGQSYFEELETWTGGIAFKPIPTLSVGASFTSLHKERPVSNTVYRATLGTELQARSLKVAAAFQSQQFGSDADALLAPSWLQLDAVMPIGPRWTVAARLSAGWWSDDARNGLLQSPFDPGVGSSYRIVPRLRVLAGVHHVRERYDLPSEPPLRDLADSPFIRRGQGTYLDGGFLLDLPASHLALSIEDNHIDSSAPHTLLTLSTGVVF